jgi:hypothetical protein
MGLVGQLWPVMRHDPSPKIYGLLAPRNHVLTELNGRLDVPISDVAFATILRDARIFDGSPDELVRRRQNEALTGTKSGVRRKDKHSPVSPDNVQNNPIKSRAVFADPKKGRSARISASHGDDADGDGGDLADSKARFENGTSA